MRKSSIEKLAEDTIESLEGAKRAEPTPFLFTRVMALINKQSPVQNIWTRLGVFLSKPSIAIAGLLLIAVLNTTILVLSKNSPDSPGVALVNPASRDEFVINTATIFDIENPEQ